MQAVISRAFENRIRPVQALVSVRRLIANPDATEEVFRIIQALKGNSLTQAVQRLREHAMGRILLESKPRILPVLCNRSWLRDLPEGTVGRAYLALMEQQNISAEGLVAASASDARHAGLTEDEQWLADRLRDIHDLQHVLTGYGPDPLGELCLLSFMTTQTYNRGISFIVFMACRSARNRFPGVEVGACVEEGAALARASLWLPAQRLEDLLAEPLIDVRVRLGMPQPLRYLATVAAQA
ncbi:MAG: ubiquinone biosynthesis protein COQ4 [Haliea sp.]|jgi:ubiquinone biosynthesis protein COQ4|nr:ubiquinone biosynthesis protein COQ4 [Haliea sp.]MDP5063831.1 ubiquinone biosynthesis protein COQ4 [Haliea sp.]